LVQLKRLSAFLHPALQVIKQHDRELPPCCIGQQMAQTAPALLGTTVRLSHNSMKHPVRSAARHIRQPQRRWHGAAHSALLPLLSASRDSICTHSHITTLEMVQYDARQQKTLHRMRCWA
jgi:hypothetical protein